MIRQLEALRRAPHLVAMARSRSRTAGAGVSQVRRRVAEKEEREEESEEQEQEEDREGEGEGEGEGDEEQEQEGGEGVEDEEEEEEVVTEYEKQRLKTIERNKAMLASLQLPTLVSALAQSGKSATNAAKASTGGGPRRRSERLKSVVSGKRRAVNDDSGSSDKSDSETESLSPNKRKRRDQEYEPTDDEGSVSESEDEMDDREEEDAPGGPGHGDMDDEEYALQQALALSLGASIDATGSPASSKKNKRRSSTKKKRAPDSAEIDPVDELEDSPKRKISKGNAKRKTQRMGTKRHFTEGEVDALFPFFDERGRGSMTLLDLERVSTTHDFTWSAEELLDMIHLFCRNHNGALDLVDFRNVATRCNLIISER